MAPLTIPIRHSLRVVNPSHFMRGMAIHAGRDQVGLLFPEFSLDHFAVDNLDLGVAVRAGFRDVFLGNGRAGIRVRQNKMCSVTAGANGGDGESAAKQSFAVDAIQVITQNVVLWNLMR